MTDTIVPSETQTLYCIYCTLQLASNPDLPWTFQNLHKRPQFEATLTPLDQYRTCILLMHTPHNHTYVDVHNGPPPTKKEQEQVLENHFKMNNIYPGFSSKPSQTTTDTLTLQHSKPFHAISQKNAPKQVTEKALSKKCKNQSCRDALPAKTLPQKPTKQATMHTGRHAQTTHTITARCIYRVPTIPTSFQPHPPQTIPHTHTQHPSTDTTIRNNHHL